MMITNAQVIAEAKMLMERARMLGLATDAPPPEKHQRSSIEIWKSMMNRKLYRATWTSRRRHGGKRAVRREDLSQNRNQNDITKQ